MLQKSGQRSFGRYSLDTMKSGLSQIWREILLEACTIGIDRETKMIHIGAENHHLMNDVYGDDMVDAIKGTEYEGFLLVFWHKGNMDGVLDRELGKNK